MGLRFDETVRGRKFFEADLPKLIRAITENTEELKRANDLKELELRQKGVLQDERDNLHDSREQAASSETFGRD